MDEYRLMMINMCRGFFSEIQSIFKYLITLSTGVVIAANSLFSEQAALELAPDETASLVSRMVVVIFASLIGFFCNLIATAIFTPYLLQVYAGDNSSITDAFPRYVAFSAVASLVVTILCLIVAAVAFLSSFLLLI